MKKIIKFLEVRHWLQKSYESLEESWNDFKRTLKVKQCGKSPKNLQKVQISGVNKTGDMAFYHPRGGVKEGLGGIATPKVSSSPLEKKNDVFRITSEIIYSMYFLGTFYAY